MRIVILCDNSVQAPGPLLAEHGFACLVEAHGRRVLFDTGQGRTLLHNADALGIELAGLDAVVISHGHCDHAGGLKALLQRCPGLKVVYHPAAFQPRYAVGPEGDRDIGIPFTEAELKNLDARPVMYRQAVELFPRLWLSGEVPRLTDFETGDERLRLGVPGERPSVVDPVSDDLSLAVVTAQGLVVIVGCAHAGLINILHHFQTVTGERRVHVLIGGTHLGPVSDRQFRQTVDALEGFAIDRLGLSHCTGLPRSAELCRRWPERTFFAAVGSTICC